ncbi:MAG: GNAT family N-acetyltransferase [Flavobacteriaceae bacterium]|nr:GNAT family N-acetyltransferase [Flavobacteriaceae bacterium]
MEKLKTFETERLLITPTTIKDAKLIYDLMNNPKFIKYVGNRKINSIQKAEKYIEQNIKPQFDRLGYGGYTITTKQGNNKIGTCGLFDRDGLEGIDIGFGLLPEFEGKGYALESAIELRNAAFEVLGIDTISAITNKENKASQKLIERLGLILKGTTKLPDEDTELFLYHQKKTL